MTLQELGIDRPKRDSTHGAPFVDPLTELGNARHLKETVCTLAAERASDPAPFTIGLATWMDSSRSTTSSALRPATRSCVRWHTG